MIAIFWIKEGQRRMCGDVAMVFVPLLAPAKAKLAVEVKNIDQLAAAWERFWRENKGVCDVPSPYIEAGSGRKIARWEDGKRYCYARTN